MTDGAGIATSRQLGGGGAALDRANAFRELADRHLDRSYALARVILDDPSEAEDATHDAFVTAWRSWASLRDPARFEAWFDRILVNTCRNRLRRRRTIEFVPEITPDLAEDPGSPYATTADRDELGEALQHLGPDQRIAVALRFYRDLSVDEIARRTGARPETVKSRIHHALRILRGALGSQDPEIDR